MSRRKTEVDYHELARSRGYEWVGGTLPANNHAKTSWRCESGHEWVISRHAIQQGDGCPYCAGLAKKTPDDYRLLAQQRGIEWVGEPVTSVDKKTMWRCEHGHKWLTNYNSVQQGQGCPHCAGNLPKTADDYHSLAAQRGIRFIGYVPPTTGHKTRWACNNGHEWETRYDNIKQGRGCHYCGGSNPLTSIDYARLAESRGFFWFDELPRNSKSKTRWQCASGHTWEAAYDSIKAGSGCPLCFNMVNSVRVSKLQLAIHAMLGGTVNYRVRRYAIDVALTVDGHNIAVEYDGWYFHNADHDAQRDAYLQGQGWRILRIKSGELLPTRKQLDAAIAELVGGASYAEIVLDDWIDVEAS